MLEILSLVVATNSLTTTYKEAACSHKEKNESVLLKCNMVNQENSQGNPMITQVSVRLAMAELNRRTRYRRREGRVRGQCKGTGQLPPVSP